jgi:hypothetical protein
MSVRGTFRPDLNERDAAESMAGSMPSERDPVRKVLSLLMPLHPQPVWDEIAKKLTSKSWHARFYVESLLKSHNGFHEDHLGRGLGIDIPPSQFLAWVKAKPEKRAATAVDWLPIVIQLVEHAVGALTAYSKQLLGQPTRVGGLIAPRLMSRLTWFSR